MKLKVFEAFAGYGSQAMALNRLRENYPQFDYEVVGISEIDKYALQAYQAVHGHCPNYGDISKIDWNTVPDFDLLTYSFPCGLEGTLVLTENGYKDISKISISDKVMTHNNRYKNVVRTMSRICDSHYKIKGVGCVLYLTSEHPLYVLRDGREQWVKVKDLKKTDMLSYCIPVENIPNKLSDSQLWLLGRYVADGYINKYLYNSVEFAIGKNKEEYFLEHIPTDLKDKFRRYEKSCYEYRVADENIQLLCEQFGNGSKNKKIPQWVLHLPNEQIDHFLDGYFSGDGHVRYKGDIKVQMFSTVSKELFLGIQLLLLKRYHKVCSLNIREDKRKETFNNTYNGQLAFSEKSLQKTIGFRTFVPIKSIEFIKGDVQVFNLEVDDDNSYTCDNVNTHNCTDISIAGQQKGLSKASDTRSSLLWECQRAIEIKRPKYLLMENVSALLSQKFLPDFKEWRNILGELGYSSFTQILNATQFGVPQNRERVFMVSILGDCQYHFPSPFKLTKRLKDVLEPVVDETYYLINKVISGFGWQPIEEPKAISYTRDKDGTVTNRHLNDIFNTIHTGTGGGGNTDCYIAEPRVMQVGNLYPDTDNFKNRTMGRVYSADGISPTINCCGGGDREPKIIATRIRKLTPRECFRLMDVSEPDIDKLLNAGISNSQLYKLAGNSIVVSCLYHIFRKMFIEPQNENQQLTLF